jgi:hypothetical protein
MPIIGEVAGSQKTVPDAPGIVSATDVGTGRAYNNGAVTVVLSAPTYTGRLPITSYTVTPSSGSASSGASTTQTVTGLLSATNYTFTANATNAVGNSPTAGPTGAVLVTTIPQAPTIGTATATGSSSATVAFTPGGTGGKTVTYTATSSPGGFTGTGTSPITVTGLTAGTAYTFTVTATNANGSAISAASNSVTPVLPGYIFTISRGSGVSPTISSSKKLSNGNFAVAMGVPQNTSTAWGGFYVLNSSGNIQIQRTINSSAKIGLVYSCGVDNADNVIIGGWNQTDNFANWTKINSSTGSIIWQKTVSSSTFTWAQDAINFDSSNNVYTATYYNVTNGGSTFWKFDSSGSTILIDTTARGSRGTPYYPTSPIGDSSGNLYAIYSRGFSSEGLYLNKFDTSGTQLIQVCWGLSGWTDTGPSCYIDSNNNIYTSVNENAAPARVQIAKWDTNLNLVWQRAFTTGNPFTDYYTKFAADSSGNLFVLIPFNNGAGDRRWVVARYNSSGTLQWQRQWQSSNDFVFGNQYGQPSIALDGTDYVISVSLTGGGNGSFKAPQDGSKTGSYSLGGVTYTYSASSLTEIAGQMTTKSASHSMAQSGHTLSNNTTMVSSASSLSTELLSI